MLPVENKSANQPENAFSEVSVSFKQLINLLLNAFVILTGRRFELGKFQNRPKFRSNN